MLFQNKVAQAKKNLFRFDVNEFGVALVIFYVADQCIIMYTRRASLGLSSLSMINWISIFLIATIVLILPYCLLIFLKPRSIRAYSIISMFYVVLIFFGYFTFFRKITMESLFPKYSNIIYLQEIISSTFGGIELIFAIFVFASVSIFHLIKLKTKFGQSISALLIYSLIGIWWFLFDALHGHDFKYTIAGLILLTTIVLRVRRSN